MTIQFCGAASEVTGSNFWLQTKQSSILIDCGLFQGRRFAEKQNHLDFPYDPAKIQAVVLTHAHLDHCGRLPKLWKDGFRGKIYCTPATRDLAELVMTDAANIMLHESEEGTQEPLYLAVDVASTMTLFEPIEYHVKTTISPGITIEQFDAGHILGSASVLVEAENKKILFSGDIGNHPVPILRPPEVPKEADLVVMEATYGGRHHESIQDRRVKLRGVIRKTVEKNGTLLIPAFAIERTQEILYELTGLIDEGSIPAIPVFLDSPLAIRATDVYHHYTRYYDKDAILIQKQLGQLFRFSTLKITESVEQSKAIAEVLGAKIIIAGSGMMEGGRILYHARNYLADPLTTLLIVGYQAKGTLGRALYEGERRVKIMDRYTTVKAHVVAIGAYSAHADQAGLSEWLHAITAPPKEVMLVHSEPEEAKAFAKLISKEYTVTIPELQMELEI